VTGVSIGRAHRTKGFVLPVLVVSLTVLLAGVGLSVDVGYLQLIKTRMQTAADAAALGGVQEIKAGGRQTAASAARSDATANGFGDGVNGVSVTVNQPPATGYYKGDATAVEVVITQNVHVLFMAVLGFQTIPVKARSVAHQGPGSDCMYVLDSKASGAFNATNGVKVSLDCGLVVDSNSGTAFTASGGAKVTAPSISVVGGYSISNGANISATPSTGAAAQIDPLSYLTPPAVGPCDHTNFTLGGGGTFSMDPGVYCNGINIANGVTVTMSPGTYVVVGGGITLGGGARITGSGVTFYLTADSTHAYGPVNIANGVKVDLSAPTADSYAGILFYQDPSIASPAASAFAGGASINFSGALYFPTSHLSYSNGTTGAYTIIVAKTIDFSGGTKLNADYSSLPGGPPVKGKAALCE
jgi:hypothetical protein